MTMDEPGSADKSEGMAMQPGMMGPGKKGCRMGMGGMKGMMPGGMGKGGMMGAAWAQAARRAAVGATPASRKNSTAS